MSSRWRRRGALLVAGLMLFILALATSASVGAYWPPYPAYGQAYAPYAYPRVAYGVPYAPVGAYVYQYTDKRFCGDGQVTATPQGYFCTTTGVPAYRSDGTITYAYGGYPYVAPNYYRWYP